MTQYTHESMRMSIPWEHRRIPHHAMSNHIKTQNAHPKNHDTSPKTNMTTVKCLLANEMTMTHHMRHIFMPLNKTLKNNLSQTTIC